MKEHIEEKMRKKGRKRKKSVRPELEKERNVYVFC